MCTLRGECAPYSARGLNGQRDDYEKRQHYSGGYDAQPSTHLDRAGQDGITVRQKRFKLVGSKNALANAKSLAIANL